MQSDERKEESKDLKERNNPSGNWIEQNWNFKLISSKKYLINLLVLLV